MTPRQVMRYLELAPAIQAGQNFRLAEIAGIVHMDARAQRRTFARWRAQASLLGGPDPGESPAAKQARWDGAWGRLRRLVPVKRTTRG